MRRGQTNRVVDNHEPMLIAQYGEDKAALDDVVSYEETKALLKILALGNREIEQGKIRPIAEVVTRLRAKKTPA